MRCRTAIFGSVIVSVLFLSAPLHAKIYIWTDGEQRVHYCNDPDDVPEPYQKKARTIETQGKRDNSRTQSTLPPAASHAAPESAAPDVAAIVKDPNQIEQLMEKYRITREELQKIRVQGKNQNSPEYDQLKNQLVEIKRQINDIRLHRDARKH